jgi:hypothetical protein
MDEPRLLHRYVPGRPHWWQWLTVLSLDAPLVAVAWQAAFARAMQVQLQGHHSFILGASVWLAYAADRWIEGWRLEPETVLTQRHWFFQKWRRPVAVAWAVVLGIALTLSVALLTQRELKFGVLLLAPVLAYLLSHQLLHRRHRWRAPKEICVALLFAAGVSCFPLAQRDGIPDGTVPPLVVFSVLCFANCALISHWEHEVDRSHGQTSLALQFPQGRPLLRALPWIIAAAGAAGAIAGPRATAGLMGCAAASGALLGGVDRVHGQLGRQLSRALADVALLTPFVLLAIEGPLRA